MAGPGGPAIFGATGVALPLIGEFPKPPVLWTSRRSGFAGPGGPAIFGATGVGCRWNLNAGVKCCYWLIVSGMLMG